MLRVSEMLLKYIWQTSFRYVFLLPSRWLSIAVDADDKHGHGKEPLGNEKRGGGYTVEMAIIVDYSEYLR